MSRFRKTIFWAHLAAGLVAGVVIAIMSATGIAIAFEEEILRWYDRNVSHVDKRSDGAVPLPISELREKVEAEIQQREGKIGDPELTTLSIARYRDTTRAWDFYVGDFGQFPLLRLPVAAQNRRGNIRNVWPSRITRCGRSDRWS